MRLNILWVPLLFTAVVAAVTGCDEKKSALGVEGPFPHPPAGLTFSMPGGEVTVFDLTDGSTLAGYDITDWPVNRAAVNGLGNRLFVLDGSHARIGVFGLPGLEQIALKPLGGQPLDLQVSISHAYVITQNSNLWVYAAGTDQADTIEVGLTPRRVAFRPQGLIVWVVCAGDCTIHVVSLPSKQVVDTLRFGSVPTDAIFSPDGMLAYIALKGFPGTIHVVSASTFEARNVFHAGRGPFDLAMSANGQFLAATDSSWGVTHIWDMLTSEYWYLPSGGPSGRVQYSRAMNAFFVCVNQLNRILRIDLESGMPVTADTVLATPNLQELVLWELN